MPKAKKPNEPQEDQSARFRAEVERLAAAGELNPIEADEALARLFDHTASSLESRRKAER